MEYDNECSDVFGYSLDTLINKKEKNEKEQEVYNRFIEYCPVIDSNSTMNKICHYIESVSEDIKKGVRK